MTVVQDKISDWTIVPLNLFQVCRPVSRCGGIAMGFWILVCKFLHTLSCHIISRFYRFHTMDFYTRKKHVVPITTKMLRGCFFSSNCYLHLFLNVHVWMLRGGETFSCKALCWKNAWEFFEKGMCIAQRWKTLYHFTSFFWRVQHFPGSLFFIYDHPNNFGGSIRLLCSLLLSELALPNPLSWVYFIHHYPLVRCSYHSTPPTSPSHSLYGLCPFS